MQKVSLLLHPQSWTQGPGCPAGLSRFLPTAMASTWARSPLSPSSGQLSTVLEALISLGQGQGEAPRCPAGSPGGRGARGSCGLPYLTPLDFSEMEPFPTLPQRRAQFLKREGNGGRGGCEVFLPVTVGVPFHLALDTWILSDFFPFYQGSQPRGWRSLCQQARFPRRARC